VAPFEQFLEAALREAGSPEPSRAPFAEAALAFERQLGALPAGTRRPAWAVELDIDLPCAPEAARKAFRRRALETHPDRPGGSHEAFLRSQRALDQALSALTGS